MTPLYHLHLLHTSAIPMFKNKVSSQLNNFMMKGIIIHQKFLIALRVISLVSLFRSSEFVQVVQFLLQPNKRELDYGIMSFVMSICKFTVLAAAIMFTTSVLGVCVLTAWLGRKKFFARFHPRN